MCLDLIEGGKEGGCRTVQPAICLTEVRAAGSSHSESIPPQLTPNPNHQGIPVQSHSRGPCKSPLIRTVSEMDGSTTLLGGGCGGCGWQGFMVWVAGGMGV